MNPNIAQELRIGNLVGLNLAEFPDNFFRMIEIAEHACVVTDRIADNTQLVDREYFEAEQLEGIPLTAEWLERFGFPKRLDGAFMDARYRGFCMRVTPMNPSGFKWTSSRFGPVIELKYVHQLQNLYYALTSEELTLKP